MTVGVRLRVARAPHLRAVAGLLHRDAVGARRLDLGLGFVAQLVVLVADDEHGARRATDDMLGHGPEDQPIEPLATVGPDHDEVCLEVRRDLENLARGIADREVPDDRGGVDVDRRAPDVLEPVAPLVERGGRARASRRGEPDHVHEVELAPAHLGREARGHAHDVLGVDAVDRREDDKPTGRDALAHARALMRERCHALTTRLRTEREAAAAVDVSLRRAERAGERTDCASGLMARACSLLRLPGGGPSA